jgi:hypothetical protein
MFFRRHEFVASLLALGLTVLPVEAQGEPPGMPLWEQLLWWLPENTETIIVAPRPFQLPKLPRDEPSFADLALLLPTGGNFDAQGLTLHAELQGQMITCAIGGARRFRPPPAQKLGIGSYEGCHVLQFHSVSNVAVRMAFENFQKKAEVTLEIAGIRVAVGSKTETSSYLVANPRPGLLILATDKDYLRQTLERMARKQEKRAIPSELPEWKHVDVKARVWAVRHYRKEFAATDPSSPFHDKSSAIGPDLDAVGFVFWYNPDNDNVAHARYLSRSNLALTKVKEGGWSVPSEGFEPKVKQTGPDAVEIASPIDKKNGVSFWFVLTGWLGHGLYI